MEVLVGMHGLVLIIFKGGSMTLLEKLNDINDFLRYGSDEIYDARQSLPDYSANESTRSGLDSAEHYVNSTMDELDILIEGIKTGKYDGDSSPGWDVDVDKKGPFIVNS